MKKLSDYKGDEAIELWADMLEPMTRVLGDSDMQKSITSGKPKLLLAKDILKSHKSDVVEILLRIDPTPINGFNLIMRLVNILTEIGQDEDVKNFFGYAAQVKKDNDSSGFATENIEVEKN